MKTFLAACVAAGILWGVDVEFNNGKYTTIAKGVVRSVLSR
jgi:hypothetical protein